MALISVWDKSGLEILIRALSDWHFKVVSSGGTARTIRSLGYEVTELSDFTGYPESPDGLVKTLHPKIHGGLLMDENNSVHLKYMKEQGIEPIKLVAVNLYPFESVIRGVSVDFRETVENIDIGGPAMIRAAAKGALLHGSPAVLVDPNQYPEVTQELDRNEGKITSKTVKALAIRAFERITEYDSCISNYLIKVEN